MKVHKNTKMEQLSSEESSHATFLIQSQSVKRKGNASFSSNV